MSSSSLTAIIVNWRTPQHTVRAARALIDDGIPADRVIIVDNASGDGSLERFAGELPGCRLEALATNVGFGPANNIGARAMPAEHAYLLVNSDAFVHGAGATARLLAAFDDPTTGIAIPRLLNPDLTLQPNVVPFSAPLAELVRASGLSRWVPNSWQPRLGTHWDHSTSATIQSAVGAVLAVRATAWDALGGFDERLYFYVEDHDLFRRAHALGWRAQFVADAEFIHLGGASSTQRWADAPRAFRIGRAEAQMLGEHLSEGQRALTLGVMATGTGMRALVHRLRGDDAAARTQAAWTRGYLSRPEPLPRRGERHR